jgi:hypothetical protein
MRLKEKVTQTPQAEAPVKSGTRRRPLTGRTRQAPA